MRKIVLILFLLCAMRTVAQVEVWHSFASAPRDMQTQQYGKATSAEVEIIRDGNRQVLVDTARYVVTNVDMELKTDSASSVEFTATDWRGTEWVIKFNRDLYADNALMRKVVILFEATKPYEWTYYFCTEEKDKE